MRGKRWTGAVMARKQYTRGDARGWLDGQAFRAGFSQRMAVNSSTLGRYKRGKYAGAFVLITSMRNFVSRREAIELHKMINNSKARIIRQWRTDKNQHIIFVLPRQKHDLLDGLLKVNGGSDGNANSLQR